MNTNTDYNNTNEDFSTNNSYSHFNTAPNTRKKQNGKIDEFNLNKKKPSTTKSTNFFKKGKDNFNKNKKNNNNYEYNSTTNTNNNIFDSTNTIEEKQITVNPKQENIENQIKFKEIKEITTTPSDFNYNINFYNTVNIAYNPQNLDNTISPLVQISNVDEEIITHTYIKTFTEKMNLECKEYVPKKKVNLFLINRRALLRRDQFMKLFNNKDQDC